MTQARYGLIIVALLIAGSLITSTAGFTSTFADRNIEVAVVSDDEAYLDIGRACANSTLSISVTNRFIPGTPLDVTIIINGSIKTIDTLAVGESQVKTFDTLDTNDTISIDASGPGVKAQLTRSLPTGC